MKMNSLIDIMLEKYNPKNNEKNNILKA